MLEIMFDKQVPQEDSFNMFMRDNPTFINRQRGEFIGMSTAMMEVLVRNIVDHEPFGIEGVRVELVQLADEEELFRRFDADLRKLYDDVAESDEPSSPRGIILMNFWCSWNGTSGGGHWAPVSNWVSREVLDDGTPDSAREDPVLVLDPFEGSKYWISSAFLPHLMVINRPQLTQLPRGYILVTTLDEQSMCCPV